MRGKDEQQLDVFSYFKLKSKRSKPRARCDTTIPIHLATFGMMGA